MGTGPGDAAGEEPKPFLRLFLSLLLLVIVGFPIWLFYGLASGSITFLGNCGPQGFIGQDGNWHGGSAASGLAAAALGGVLWVAAGAAVWRRRQTAVVVLGFTVLYVVALIVLGVGLSRVIWGPRHCVIS